MEALQAKAIYALLYLMHFILFGSAVTGVHRRQVHCSLSWHVVSSEKWKNKKFSFSISQEWAGRVDI